MCHIFVANVERKYSLDGTTIKDNTSTLVTLIKCSLNKELENFQLSIRVHYLNARNTKNLIHSDKNLNAVC